MTQWLQRVLAPAAALVSAVTDRLARWVAPVTPWLFVALQRAWVPTLVAAVAALMFFAVPQSREVLRGLSEPALGSLDDFDYEKQRGAINSLAWVAYVGSAAVLGAMVWYAARLLATVGAQRGTPNALEAPLPGHANLLRAITWYPRWLGAGVLAASVGALIYANYTPQLSDMLGLLLAVMSVVGPWMLAVGAWQRSHARATSRWRGWLVVGALVAVGAAVWLVMARQDKWPVWAWSLGCSLWPAALWLWLAERRARLQRRRHHTLSDPAASRSFGSVIVITMLLALGGGAALLLLALLPPLPIRTFGSAATVLVFLAATCAFASAGQLWLRYVASDVPGLTTAITAVLILLVALVGQEDLGDEGLDPPAKEAAALAPAKAASAPVVPMVYVNAAGGGLRAAVFTALVLAQADDASCGEFGRRLAALSGVSGGSLGLATYLVARQELSAAADGAAWQGCSGPEVADLPLTRVVAHALVQDHLSPVISRMLAVDAPHLHGLIGQPPTRGQALLDSWNGALVSGLADALSQDDKHPADKSRFAGFALPLPQLHGGLNPAPAAYFNATDADSGHVVWFSNVAGGKVGTQIGGESKSFPNGLSVGAAVLHSARFPLVTPAGGFEAPWPHGALRSRLVDGGYADNSGATTLLGVSPRGVPLAVNIDGNPSPVKRCTAEKDGHPPIVTAVLGLLRARSAHADQALARLQQSFAGDNNQLENRLNIGLDLERVYRGTGQAEASCARIKRAQQPPLGWYMSYEAAVLLVRSSRHGAEDLCKQLKLTCYRMPELPPLPDAAAADAANAAR